MTAEWVPARIARAVELLAPRPGQELLEIGCGPGVAVSLLCDAGARVTAIDRSATQVARAGRRNAAEVADGRAVLCEASLDALELPPASFDAAFAINVNLFWTGPAARELATVRALLRPGGALHLFYEAPSADRAEHAAQRSSAALAAAGFAVERRDVPKLVCVSGQPPASTAS